MLNKSHFSFDFQCEMGKLSLTRALTQQEYVTIREWVCMCVYFNQE